MAQPYKSGMEHLVDEMACADVLVKDQTRRWRQTIAATKSQDWGMAYVDDQEVSRYLDSEFRLGPGDQPAVPTDIGRTLIEARIAATPNAGATLPLVRLVQAFGLSAAERDVLLLTLLPELDSRYRRLYGYLLDNGSCWSPTIGLLDEMLSPAGTGPLAARSLLENGRPLIDQHLVVPAPWSVPDGPARRAVRIDDRIAAFLIGSAAVDPRLAESAEIIDGDAPSTILPPARAKLLKALTTQPGARIVLSGADLPAYRRVAVAIAKHAGRPLLAVSADAAAGDHGELFVRLAVREARLIDAVLFWHGCDALFDHGRPLPVWAQVLAGSGGYRGVSVFDHAAPWDPEGRAASTPMVRWTIDRPSVSDREAQWIGLLQRIVLAKDVKSDDAAAKLSQSFDLSEAQIRDAAATAGDLALTADPVARTVTLEHLMEACRRQSGRRLLTFTQRVAIPPAVKIDNTLVLPTQQKEQLHALVDRIRYRHILAERHPEDSWRRPEGVVVLFAGSSGCGKTLAAACVASELGKDLLRVDLPAVVSKWVGETEKNLQQVFAEAEDANAVMFFDEAESFFAKRGEVRGAQDRWAMMETDYLLQRIEGYTGAVILATNLRQQIDEAFLRRIHVVVEFPFPDAEQREELWRRSLAKWCRILGAESQNSSFDAGTLAASHSLTGASIDAALESAAYASRGDAAAFNQESLLMAISLELRKLGKF